jgi:hypothetical protein
MIIIASDNSSSSAGHEDECCADDHDMYETVVCVCHVQIYVDVAPIRDL